MDQARELEALLERKGIAPADQTAILTFQRFLSEFGQPTPENLRAHPGWLPYVLGGFFDLKEMVAPPEGYGDVPLPAWTYPG